MSGGGGGGFLDHFIVDLNHRDLAVLDNRPYKLSILMHTTIGIDLPYANCPVSLGLRLNIRVAVIEARL